MYFSHIRIWLWYIAIIEDCVDTSLQGLKFCIKKGKEGQIRVASNTFDTIKTNRMKTKTQKHKWKEKQLYGNFKRQTSEISDEKTLTWLKKGNLTKENEFSLIAAQHHKDQLKQKSVICNRIASVGYFMTKIKLLII